MAAQLSAFFDKKFVVGSR